MFRFVNTSKMLRLFSLILFIFALQQLKLINCEPFTSSYSFPGTPGYQQSVDLYKKLQANGFRFNGPMAGSPSYMGTFYPIMPPMYVQK